MSNFDDDLIGVQDVRNDLGHNLIQRPLVEGTAKFTEQLFGKAKASTAPMFQNAQEMEYLRGNHFTLGEQVRSPEPPQQPFGFHNKSKSAQLDRHLYCDDFQSASFRHRIKNLSNTFLGRRSKSIADQGRLREIPAHGKSSPRLPILDATKLKYNSNNLEIQDPQLQQPASYTPLRDLGTSGQQLLQSPAAP